MRCWSCQEENRGARQYCRACGALLQLICQHCRTANDRFSMPRPDLPAGYILLRSAGPGRMAGHTGTGCTGSERLDDHQNDNGDHQSCRYLIDNAIEFLAMRIPVGGEIPHHA